MKRIYTTLFTLIITVTMMAQGWPAQYGGVMLQGFYWDSFEDSHWTVLEKQADQLAGTFDLLWLPQSGNCGGTSMGYDDLYWFSNYDSSFGNETELRALITKMKGKGIKTIADVVINHRKELSNWVVFPKETYKGVTYEMKSTDVVSDDDGGKTKTWATQNGYTLSSNADTGEGWDGMRDLDHTSANVQTIVKAYLGFLKNDLGYAGFRYDMVKGYSAQYTGQYNAASNPEFSVGEYWDGNASAVKNWINGTKQNDVIQSAAFDFPFRYTVRDAINGNNWTKLANASIMSDATYRRYAVTFVENHDTEKRSNAAQDPIVRDTLAANAFMLAMPGTPCVFMKHWQAYPSQIKAMVAARKTAGITSESTYSNFRSNTAYYANIVKVNNVNRLLVVVGNTAALESTISTAQWTKVLSGHHYAYYLPTSMNTAYADLPSGTYEGEQKVRLSAITATAGAQLVYTTNGSDPTASSTKAASGATITIPTGTTTLKVGLLINNQVSGTATYAYTIMEPQQQEQTTIPDFCVVNNGETCAFFEAPTTWTGTIKCWAWGNGGSPNYTGGTWPGEACTLLGTAPNGNKVWKWTYSGTLTTIPSMIIFSNNGAPQTNDLPFQNGGYYTRDGLFGVVTGIKNLTPALSEGEGAIYDLQGRRIDDSQLKPGIYIKNHRKILIR